jgi:hypothetical protein
MRFNIIAAFLSFYLLGLSYCNPAGEAVVTSVAKTNAMKEFGKAAANGFERGGQGPIYVYRSCSVPVDGLRCQY